MLYSVAAETGRSGTASSVAACGFKLNRSRFRRARCAARAAAQAVPLCVRSAKARRLSTEGPMEEERERERADGELRDEDRAGAEDGALDGRTEAAIPQRNRREVNPLRSVRRARGSSRQSLRAGAGPEVLEGAAPSSGEGWARSFRRE